MMTPNLESVSCDAPLSQWDAGGTGAARPALGSSVSADLDALRNDVEQARALACEYQHQLADKSNDIATLRQLFEKTRDDLVHLQNGVTQLREERHQFANDAMRAAALELKLGRVTAERDRLREELVAFREGRGAAAPSSPSATAAAGERAIGGKVRERITVPFFEPISPDDITLVPNDPNSAAAAKLRRR